MIHLLFVLKTYNKECTINYWIISYNQTLIVKLYQNLCVKSTNTILKVTSNVQCPIVWNKKTSILKLFHTIVCKIIANYCQLLLLSPEHGTEISHFPWETQSWRLLHTLLSAASISWLVEGDLALVVIFRKWKEIVGFLPSQKWWKFVRHVVFFQITS